MNADLMLNRPAVVALCCTRCIATACSCQHGKLPVTFSLPRMDVIPPLRRDLVSMGLWLIVWDVFFLSIFISELSWSMPHLSPTCFCHEQPPSIAAKPAPWEHNRASGCSELGVEWPDVPPSGMQAGCSTLGQGGSQGDTACVALVKRFEGRVLCFFSFFFLNDFILLWTTHFRIPQTYWNTQELFYWLQWDLALTPHCQYHSQRY